MYPGGNMIWMAYGWLVALAVIAAIVWSLLTLINALVGPSHAKVSPDKILKRRLADGEIDVKEYAKRTAALSKTKRAA